VDGCYKHGNESSDSIKGGSNYKLLKKNYVPWGQLKMNEYNFRYNLYEVPISSTYKWATKTCNIKQASGNNYGCTVIKETRLLRN
jgi:hypothetical protein